MNLSAQFWTSEAISQVRISRMSAGIQRDIGSEEYTCADSDEASVEDGAAGIDECSASDTDIRSVIRVERGNYDRLVVE